MKSRIASGYDLLAVLGLSFVYMLSLLVMPGTVFHALLGLPFALILPGYALQASVYPRRDELEPPLRWAFGCAFSLTLVIILAMILSAVGQLDVVWLAGCLELIIIACCVIAYLRRSRLAPDTRATRPPDAPRSRRPIARLLPPVVLAIAGLVLVAGIFIVLLGGRQEQTYTTAFYLLGDNGQAGNYPSEVTFGRPFSVTLGIVNHEQDAATYRINVQVDDQGPEALDQVSLQPGETWERTFNVTVNGAESAAARVGFNLYRDSGADPYRSLHMRVQNAFLAPGGE